MFHGTRREPPARRSSTTIDSRADGEDSHRRGFELVKVSNATEVAKGGAVVAGFDSARLLDAELTAGMQGAPRRADRKHRSWR